MISGQACRFWDLMRAGPKQIAMPIAERRAAGEHAEDATAEPAGVAFAPAARGGGIWAQPAEARPGAAMLYLFGGGYMPGSPASRRKTAGHLAAAAGARVLVPNYRLAPEHPFPAAVDDAVQAYRWLLAQGAEPTRTVIAGDSAGGGLAVATVIAARDRAPAAAGRDRDPLRLGRSHLQRRQHDEPCGDRHRVHPGRPPRDGRLVHERRRPAPAPGLAGVRRLRRPAAAPRPGRRRRDAARRFHPPRARCRHGRRRRHALHRRRHAARVPDLGRRLPRGRRGDRHDRRLGPGTHGLRPHAARARISAWRSALPSKPIPGSSGITMCPASTRTPSGKPP
jgi:hypothetical protein